jgi:hypothetical protein
MIFLGIEDVSAEISRVSVSPYLSSFARGMSYAALGIAQDLSIGEKFTSACSGSKTRQLLNG